MKKKLNRLFRAFQPWIPRSVVPDAKLGRFSANVSVLPISTNTDESERRREWRFPVKFEADLYATAGKASPIKVCNISSAGLEIYSDAPIPFGCASKIVIRLSKTETVHILAHPIWRAKEHVYGFKILVSCGVWQSLIKHLEVSLSLNEKVSNL